MDLLRRIPYLKKGGTIPVGFSAAENHKTLIDYPKSGTLGTCEVIKTQYTEVIPRRISWSSRLSYYF